MLYQCEKILESVGFDSEYGGEQSCKYEVHFPDRDIAAMCNIPVMWDQLLRKILGSVDQLVSSLEVWLMVNHN